jgi:hypothetical protein
MSVVLTVLVVIVVLVMLPAIVMRMRGYQVGGRIVVRCRQGHLFTTIWTPGVSLKAVRLGWWRLQRCPVGNHWSLVHPVKESDLTEEQKQSAQEATDLALP